MSRIVQVGVELTDHVTILQIPTAKSTIGKEFLQSTIAALGGIPEPELQFFGFRYVDKKQQFSWLNLQEKVWKQLEVNKDSSVQCMVQFRVKLYPEDVTREVDPYSMSLKLLYLQVREAVKAKEIECSYEVSQELTRAEVNCKIQIPSASGRGPTTPTNYSFQFAHHRASSPGDIQAMLTYLEIVQRLPSYGITYFEGKDKLGTSIYLGIHAFGISIHNFVNRAVVESKLDWAAIQNIKFVEKKLVVSFIDKGITPVVLFFPHRRTCDQILSLAMGNHRLYNLKRSGQ